MNVLFLWNESSKNYISNFLDDSKQFSGGNRLIITNEKDFDDFLEKQFQVDGRTLSKKEKVKRGKKNSDLLFQRIYILAELDWLNDSLYLGYKKGFELIGKINDFEPLIEFYSFQNRINIYEQIDERLKFIVKAFPFTDILQIQKGYKFKTSPISSSKWKFIKTYAIQDYGILDVLSHRLDGLNDTQPEIKTHLNKLITELKAYKSFSGKDIQVYVEQVEYNNSYMFQLKFLIENRIEELTGEQVGLKFELPNSIRILVVEDERDDADVILNALKRHYKNDDDFNKNVIWVNEGEVALNYIEDNKDTLDFIITDLQLLDKEGFYQPIQGVEVFEKAKELPSSAVGVITGFGRKGISKLLDYDTKFILLKKHLKTFNAFAEIDILLQNLFFNYQIKVNTVIYDAGPIKGWISNPMYRKLYSNLRNEKPEVHRNNFEKALDFVKLYQKGELNLSTKGWNSELVKTQNVSEKSKLENVLKKHYSFLAQRLIVLTYAAANDFVFDKIEFKEKAAHWRHSKGDNEFNPDRNYLTTQLGLHLALYSASNKNIRTSDNGIILNGKYEGRLKEEIRIIKKENLFPEEREWLEHITGSKEEYTIGSQSTECAKWLQENLFEFIPNIDFSIISFEELFQLLSDLLDKKKSGDLDEDRLDDVLTNVPSALEQYLTSREKKIANKLNELYNASYRE